MGTAVAAGRARGLLAVRDERRIYQGAAGWGGGGVPGSGCWTGTGTTSWGCWGTCRAPPSTSTSWWARRRGGGGGGGVQWETEECWGWGLGGGGNACDGLATRQAQHGKPACSGRVEGGGGGGGWLRGGARGGPHSRTEHSGGATPGCPSRDPWVAGRALGPGRLEPGEAESAAAAAAAAQRGSSTVQRVLSMQQVGARPTL